MRPNQLSFNVDSRLCDLLLAHPTLSNLALRALFTIYRDADTKWTQSALARHLGASREGLRKALAQLHDTQLITLQAGKPRPTANFFSKTCPPQLAI